MAARITAAGRPIDPPYLSQIVRGVRRPGVDLALAIEKATGGEISLDALLRWEIAA